MKYFLPLIVFFCFGGKTYAQTAGDVIRYSFYQPVGTARFTGAGGAFGALGADFSTSSQNPAGIGMFRSNELVLTPGMRFAHVDARLPGVNAENSDDKNTFNFDNFGLVFYSPIRPKGYTTKTVRDSTIRTPQPGWRAFNVALGLNHLNSFHQSIFYSGDGDGSIMNGFFANAESIIKAGGSSADFNPFADSLAFEAGGIYYQNGELSYDFIGNEAAAIRRTHALTSFGRMNEMVLTFAGNYDDRLSVGATVGVPFVKYRLEGEYVESDPNGKVEYFDDLAYTEYLQTEGLGVNLKLGFTYKLHQMFRVGGAFHTPTRLSLTDNFSNTFEYGFTDGTGPNTSDTERSPDGVFDYRLRTPWRALGSAAVVLKKFGFISADIEYVDYRENRYDFTVDVKSTENELFEREVNTDIRNTYQAATNIRIGTELLFGKFRLRGGINLLGKPYKGETGYTPVYSLGAGVRNDNFYLDLGYRLLSGEGSVEPYPGAPVASTDVRNGNLQFTLGFKF